MTRFERICALVEAAAFHRYPLLYRSAYELYKQVAERRERAVFKQYAGSGANVIDVGAYIGVYTRLFKSQVGPAGEVHAFEPDPLNFKLLSRFTGTVPGVFLNEGAVGAKSGSVRFYRSSSLSVDHRCFSGADDERECVERPCIALDDYWPVGKPLHFMKVDVQGYEEQVFKGARRVLSENHDLVVFFEYFPSAFQSAGSKPSFFYDWFRALGYQLYAVGPQAKLTHLGGRLPKVKEGGYIDLLAKRGAACS